MTKDDDKREALITEVGLELEELRQAADRLDEVVAAQFSLNRTDLRCLGVLYRRGRVTAGELADESGLTPGAITTVLDRLERGGYANRVADPNDRRRVLVISTAATREIGARVYGEVEIAGRSELDGRTPDELIVIRDYLRRTREMYEREASEIVGQAPEAQAAAGTAEGPPLSSAPLGGVTAGRLEFTKGASAVKIRADAELQDLYRATFDGPAPDVSVSGGTIVIQQRRRLLPFGRTQTADVALNPAVPWSVSLKGGMWELTADLRGLRLESLTVGGGASDVTLWLPAPVGIVPVVVTGGASSVDIHRPAGAAMRAAISGGASQLDFDGQRVGGVGGRNVLESPGFDAAADRYEMRFSGGASTVTIDTF
jgi:DNA-binding MarR family transcriptional regulator